MLHLYENNTVTTRNTSYTVGCNRVFFSRRLISWAIDTNALGPVLIVGFDENIHTLR